MALRFFFAAQATVKEAEVAVTVAVGVVAPATVNDAAFDDVSPSLHRNYSH